MAGDQAAGLRYAAWRGTYRLDPCAHVRSSLRTSRVRRAGAVLVAAVVVLVLVGSAVRVVTALARGDLLALLDVLVFPGVIVLISAAWLRWPPQTRITEDALVVRSVPWSTRSEPWSRVTEVGPPGRFDEHPVARLVDGGRVALVGLPVEVARAMAEADRPGPRTRSSGPPRSPAPRDDLDRPFHRGRAGAQGSQ